MNKRTQGARPSVDRTTERDEVIHEYDGIQEYDNRLPTWWLYTLFGAIVFSGGYWLYYQTFRLGAPSEAASKKETSVAAAATATSTVTPAELVALSKNPDAVKAGQAVFTTNCVACHGANAGGGPIGPNLTDSSWIHGGAPEKIFATVHNGVLTKGMPAWGPQLGERKVQSVVAYVLTLRNTNVAGGKSPQGEKEE